MKNFLFITILLLALTSCKVSFVPSSSTAMKAQVTQGIKTTDSLFVAETANTDKSFATYQATYVQVQNTITSIQVQDSLRAKSGLILLQVARLQSHFNTVVNNHKIKGYLNNAEIETNKNIINALWLPILVSENSLK
jgi:hypothetical protein